MSEHNAAIEERQQAQQQQLKQKQPRKANQNQEPEPEEEVGLTKDGAWEKGTRSGTVPINSDEEIWLWS